MQLSNALTTQLRMQANTCWQKHATGARREAPQNDVDVESQQYQRRLPTMIRARA